MSTLKDQRPLSPHLSIYRWQITNTLSILHRMTGVALAIGLLVMAAWLIGAAYCPALASAVTLLTGSVVGYVFFVGWTLAFYYHLGNGIRHLQWDRVRGMSMPEVTASGRLAIIFALAMTVFTWALILDKLGA